MGGSHPTAPLVTQRARCRGLSVARGRGHHLGKKRSRVDHDTSRGRQGRNLPLAAAPTPCARSWKRTLRLIPVWLPIRHFLRAAARRLGRDLLACVPRCSYELILASTRSSRAWDHDTCLRPGYRLEWPASSASRGGLELLLATFVCHFLRWVRRGSSPVSTALHYSAWRDHS